MRTKSMVLLATVTGVVSTRAAAQAVGQADVLIQSLSVVAAPPQPMARGAIPSRPARQPAGGTVAPLPASTALDIQVVVFSYNDDDAQNVKLNIFLPPETHAVALPAGCAAPVTNNGSTGISNAFVTCTLGAMGVNASRAINLTISRPPSFVVPRVGVFAWSETPDPNTANNHAEAVAP